MQLDKTKTKDEPSGKEQFTLGWDGRQRISYSPRRKKKKPGDARAAWYHLGLVGDVGFAIAIPIAGGAIIGTQVDKYFSSYPRATLALMGVGIVVAGGGFIQILKEAIRKKK